MRRLTFDRLETRATPGDLFTVSPSGIPLNWGDGQLPIVTTMPSSMLPPTPPPPVDRGDCPAPIAATPEAQQ
jgi:hypothetical protein